jgi:hypothetical protein
MKRPAPCRMFSQDGIVVLGRNHNEGLPNERKGSPRPVAEQLFNGGADAGTRAGWYAIIESGGGTNHRRPVTTSPRVSGLWL